MNEESGTTNMELPITCMSVCVSRAVIQLLTAKNTSVTEIHRQPTKVYGTVVRNNIDTIDTVSIPFGIVDYRYRIYVSILGMVTGIVTKNGKKIK